MSHVGARHRERVVASTQQAVAVRAPPRAWRWDAPLHASGHSLASDLRVARSNVRSRPGNVHIRISRPAIGVVSIVDQTRSGAVTRRQQTLALLAQRSIPVPSALPCMPIAGRRGSPSAAPCTIRPPSRTVPQFSPALAFQSAARGMLRQPLSASPSPSSAPSVQFLETEL